MEKGADSVTPIESIRAEVGAVRKLHAPCIAEGVDGIPVDGMCASCEDTQYPCPTLRLAEDKLKLAEALEKCGESLGKLWHTTGKELAERVLSEVAR